MKYIYTAITVALVVSGVSLWQSYQRDLIAFDSDDQLDIQEIPVKLAVYLIDKNLKIVSERLTNVAALQQLIIEKQEEQGQINIQTEQRLTAEESKE